MRHHLPLVITALLSMSPAAAQDLPARKAGLWDLKMTMEGQGAPPQAMQQYIDNATDKAMNSPSGGMGNSRCTQQSIKRSGNTITIESVCETPRGPNNTTAVMTGDFNSAYSVKVATRQQGGPVTNMSLDAKYLGACKADQKPGDMIMANGMKVNINDMRRGGGMVPNIPGAPRPPQAPR